MESVFKLTRQYLETEGIAAKAAILAHEEGIVLHEIMKKAFERELEAFPVEKEEVEDAPVCSD